MKDQFFKSGIELSGEQKYQLIAILTKRCGEKNYRRIESMVRCDFDTLIKTFYSLQRFYISHLDNKVHYCAGQSYPCEIKSIRNEILKKFP